MANTKSLRGPAPKQNTSEGLPVSNSTNKKPTRGRPKARQQKQVELPPIGEVHQTWIWRQGGSGTFTLPSTKKITLPTENGVKQDTILYSEGSPSVLMSEMVNWNDKPVKSPIRMYNSMLHVPADNETLQRYLVYLTHYGDFSDIYLDDPEAEARKEAELFDLMDANTEAIQDMDAVALRSLAHTLSIGVDSVTPKRAVINRIRSLNQKNPQQLSKALANDGAEVYFICSEIFVNGFADLNSGTIVWEDGSSILQVPSNQDAKTFLAMEMLNTENLRKTWYPKFKEALLEHYPS